jgi:hypothetical protein
MHDPPWHVGLSTATQSIIIIAVQYCPRDKERKITLYCFGRYRGLALQYDHNSFGMTRKKSLLFPMGVKKNHVGSEDSTRPLFATALLPNAPRTTHPLLRFRFGGAVNSSSFSCPSTDPYSTTLDLFCPDLENAKKRKISNIKRS